MAGGQPPELKPKRRRRSIVLALAAVLVAAVAAYALAPAEFPGRTSTVLIRPGEAMPAVARDLEAAGLVRNARAFALLARLTDGRARAGEFLLSSGWSPLTTLRVLTTTNGIQHRVAVREGLPWWAAAKLFADEGLCSVPDFERAMHNASLLQKYGVPGDSAEGFLFPDTYLVSKSFGDGGAACVETMLKEFRRQAQKLWPGGPPPAKELLRVVTLASIVERETGDPAERPRIAGVFLNRLKTGMPLQSDPTIIYGLGPAFDGKLGRADLENAGNPYNTYTRYGLPPGPICSPGLAALTAVLRPEASADLYFVAKGDGTHEFSRTLEEHNTAVARYQRHRAADYRSVFAGAPAAQANATAPEATAPTVPAKPAAPKPAAPVRAKPVRAKAAKVKPSHGKTAKAAASKAPTAKRKATAKHAPAKAKKAKHRTSRKAASGRR